MTTLMWKNVELEKCMRHWEEEYRRPDFNPIPTLNKMCEILKFKIENYPQQNQPPFEMIFHHYDNFMNKLVMDYLSDNWSENVKDNNAISIAACRLIMNIKLSFLTHLRKKSRNDLVKLVQKLFSYAQSPFEPLHTCGISLLASSLKLSTIVSIFREDFEKLIPVVLNCLEVFYKQFNKENKINMKAKSFPHPNNCQTMFVKQPPKKRMRRTSLSNTGSVNTAEDSIQNMNILVNLSNKSEENAICGDGHLPLEAYDSFKKNWKEIDPLTLTTKFIYHLNFMFSSGKIKVLNRAIFETNSNLVLEIIKSSCRHNNYLTKEAFKFLDVLLSYKIYAVKFISSQGLQKLLSFPKSSILDKCVPNSLYNLFSSEEVMEQIGKLPKKVIVNLIKYLLSMLELSSSIINAIGFFAKFFCYKVILEIFDNHDGLRKLINATTRIILSRNPNFCSIAYSEKEILYCFCWSLKEYFEAHLHIKVQQVQMSSFPKHERNKMYKSIVDDEIELLSNNLSRIRHWKPFDQFMQFGGLNLILNIINGVQKWNCSYSCHIFLMAFKILKICVVLPKFQLKFCEPIHKIQGDISNNGLINIQDSQYRTGSVGLNIVMKVTETYSSYHSLRFDALSILNTCVCGPIDMDGGSIANKRKYKTNDRAMIEKNWNCIRNYNGIMILLDSMNIKTPHYDNDKIRNLAIITLAGLARSESVRQILSKLPLFKKDQLQDLMKNSEQGTFQKNVSKLMELIHGETKTNTAKIETSLVNINRNPSVGGVNNQCTNFVMRFSKNIHSRRLDQKLVHSRFCPTSKQLMVNHSVHCEFINENRIAVGTKSGTIKVFNLFTLQEELSLMAHTSCITNLECSKDERLFVSSCDKYVSSLWSRSGESMSLKYTLAHTQHSTLSNYCQNKLLGTLSKIVTIYDVETSKKLMRFIPKHSNQYHKNKATFNPSDELVFSDGVLWDATSGKEIHKFDKLHTNASGIFHPYRQEIISNTEVWDVRTFKLLSTVPHLDDYSLTFSNSGEGMYIFIDYYKPFQTSFKTLDPWDYSLIATIDVNKSLLHMAINKNDTQIAVTGATGTLESNIIEIYDVGRPNTED